MSGKVFNWLIGVFVFFLLIAVGLGLGSSFLEFSLFNLNSDGSDLSDLRNPVLGLSDKEAEEAFDEEFVLFLLYSIGAHNLRDSPISFEEPRIEILVDDETFNAIVEKGGISVGVGAIEGEDVFVRTSAKEAVKMLRDRSYVVESFRSGGSSMELVASRAKLLGKGYLRIYNNVGS